MPARRVDAVSEEAAELGEGPRYDAARREVLWVDIPAGVLRRAALEGGRLRTTAEHRLDVPVGAAAPLAGGDGWVLAAGTGFVRLAEDGAVAALADAAPGEGARLRMNDGGCDPAGRFLAGLMAFDAEAGAGSLHRLGPGGRLELLRAGTTISNGLGWSPDGTALYWADSGPAQVRRFGYDVDDGALTGEEVLLDLGGGPGVPDGLAVDDDGCLWVAVHGAGVVRWYAPDGRRLEEVALPVTQPTAVCLVGTTLLVTTAREGLDARALAGQPDAGRVLAVEVDVAGPPVVPYRP